MNISLCMIVKNESETIGRCLESIKDAVDEIIIVDTGSTDKTKDIVYKYTDKVFNFEWCDDFSAARNYAFSFATKDWIMWLDADDVISESSLRELKKLKHKTISANAIYMKYNIAFDQLGNPTFSYYRERIVKRSAKPLWIEPIHEALTHQGNYILVDIAVEHRKEKENPKKRNLKIFEKQIKLGRVLSPRLQYYYARELMYNQRFKKAIRIFENFLHENKGWIENNIEACRELAFCYKMLNQRQKAYESLFKSFYYALPRGENLCKIAELYNQDGNLLQSKYYYELALKAKLDENNLGFVEKDYYNFIPAIELCVIEHKLGNRNKAIEYNELAGKYKPTNPAYLYKKQFFGNN